jgi:mRNA interferase MazF
VIQEGQVVLFEFPQTDQKTRKLRPALVLRKVPGPYDDWLICMISSELSQEISGLDEPILEDHKDFKASGLKKSSLIRIGRLAVVHKDILLGAIGSIEQERLKRIRTKLSAWLTST